MFRMWRWKMGSLLFLEEGHKYQLDGEELPSVSELTRFISREVYGEVNQYTLDMAAQRGTAVHKATEVLDKYGKAEIDDEYVEYLKAYVKFRKEHKCEWDKIEYADYHETYRYCGTIDRLSKDGVLYDIKTSYTVHKQMVTAQLSLYKMLLESHGIEVKEMKIIHLTKTGEYKLVDIPFREDIAMSCITLNEFMKKKKRGKNK